MAEPDFEEHQLTVELEDTGEQVSVGIVSYMMNSEFTVATDGWEFTVYSEDDPRGLRRKFMPLTPVRLYIDGQQQVIGRIDKTESAGGSGKELRVTGRDYIADICDASVDPTTRFAKDTTVAGAIITIAAPFGIAKVGGEKGNVTRNLLTGKSRFNKTPVRDFKAAKMEDFKPDENEGAFELINKIVARHGFTLQPGTSRDEVLMVAPDYTQEPTFALKRPGNVLTAKASRDYSTIPTVTVTSGRKVIPGHQVDPMIRAISTFGVPTLNGVPIIPDKSTDSKTLTILGSATLFDKDSPVSFAKNAEVARIVGRTFGLYRPIFYQDKVARNQEQIQRGLNRVISDRLRKTLEYTCTVRGHRDPTTGALYAVDTIAQIEDDIEDVSEPLWCVERTFRNDGSGPMTDLGFIRPGSWVL